MANTITDGSTAAGSTTKLITVADAKTYLGVTGTDDDAILGDMVDAATETIENHCEHKFNSANYTQWLDGSGESRLWLPEWPITAVGMLSLSSVDAMTVESGDTSATHATVAVTGTAVVLLLSDGDNAATTTLTFANYTTLDLMATQIEATAGSWSASSVSPYGSYRSSKLRELPAQFAHDNIAYLKMPGDPESGFRFQEDEGYIVQSSGVFRRGTRNVYVEWTAGYDTVPQTVQQVAKEVVAWMYHYSQREDTTLKSMTIDAVSWTAAAQQDGRQNILTSDQMRRLAPHRGLLE